jgi:hypothetical protein
MMPSSAIYKLTKMGIGIKADAAGIGIPASII